MKLFFSFLITSLFVFSCESKRPDANSFEYSLIVNSIQKNADVEILDGEKSVSTAVTDENGAVSFDSLSVVSNLKIKVCGGTVNLVSSEEPVAWTGCNETMFTPVEKETNTVVVDFLSTFITSYACKTSTQEWIDYLDITTLSTPILQTSLTDSTKRYLWLQGFAVIAKNISQANGVNPETQYSTENLINLIKDDLDDDQIINSSTEKMFGTLSIDSAVLKNIIADAIKDVSENFSASDLKDWTDKLTNSNAKFLGGSENDIDNEKPIIKIVEPSGENPTVWGEVLVQITATDDKKIASLDCGITSPENAPKIVDTQDETELFIGFFDSTLLEDGELKIKCIASDGTNISEKEFSITVSNNNEVELKAYITNELTSWDSVMVYDYDGEKVKTYSFKEDEAPVIGLAPGDYTFIFKGGFYKPVFLNDESIEFDSELSTNQAILPGETTKVIATPLTTIREKLYSVFKSKMSHQDAVEKSFTLISEHVDGDFPLYIEPVSKNQFTENSKYYIVLAGLERLAVLIGERHDPTLETGAITIEQVIKAIVDDIETVGEGVLDGNDLINQFTVDSYLFRYWYAIAVKLFLESEENLTGLGFSDLQTVITNISMDNSELFPEDKAPKKVTDQPPVISEKQFMRSFETDFQNYSIENIIYANNSVFSIKFKTLPDEAGDLEIDLVEIFGDVAVQNLSHNDEGIYTAELTFTDEADGEKTVGINVLDNAENTGMATLQAVKDTVNPIIDKFELLRGKTVLAGEYTTVPFTADYEITEANFRNAQVAVKTSVNSGDFVYDKEVSTSLVGDFQINKSDLPADGDDGSYNFSVKFTDKAGNETTTEFQKTIDTVAPVIESIVMTPPINANGFIDSREITVDISATDNIEQTLNYWYRRNEASYGQNLNAPPHIFNIQEPADASIVYYFKVSDQAGNETPESNAFSFTIDTVNPVVTISNKDAIKGNFFMSTSSSLLFSYTIEEINLEYCELRINGSKSDDITVIPAGTITFTGSKLLDSTIGPATPNTASIYCIDLAGRETENTVSFYIDDDAPAININPDQLGGSVIDDDQVAIDSLITDNFGREGNLTVKFKYRNDTFNSLGYSNIYYFPISGMREIDDWGDSNKNASCSINDDSCRFWIPHIDDDSLHYGKWLKLYHNNNNFTLYLEVTDKAGNKSENTFSYTVDKEPVPMNSGGYEYDDGKIYLGFSSDKSIPGFRMRVNGFFTDPECYHAYFDNMEKHFYSCPFNANTGTTYAVAISSKDSFENMSFDDCNKFQDSDSNFCFEGNITADLPNLSVIVTGNTGTTVFYTISSDSTIIDCKILKDGSFFQDCDKSTGDFSETISTWEEGVYTITATAKNTIGAETTRSDDFVIDNTVTSFNLEINNYNEIYYNSAPAIKINAKIAGGVKNVQLFLEKRKLHRSRAGNLDHCIGTYCYETYSVKIAELTPSVFYVNFKPVFFFHPYTPSPDLFEPGYYDSIRWVITSNRNGESDSGHFLLADTPIRIAKSASDFAQTLSVSVNEDEEELEMQFRPSVFSTANLSSTADFDFQVLNNPDIDKNSNYHQICGDNNTDFKKQFRHYDSKIKVALNRLSYSGSTKKYTAYFKPNLDSYRYNYIIPSTSNYYAFAPCGNDSDCPSDTAHYDISEGCESMYYDDWEEEPGPDLCEPNYIKHYSSDNDISALKICKISTGSSCSEYFETCPNPTYYPVFYQDWHSYGYGYLEECPLLRDFWYFPKNLKIKGVDDFSRSDTITLSSDYTDPEECPQYKRLNSF